MNKKFFNVIVILICFTFAGTLIGTGAVLYEDYKIGQTSAREKLDKLYRQTEESISYYKYPDSDFIKSFTRAIGSPDYYYTIKLETPSQEIYVFPSEKSSKRGLTITDSRRITEGNTVDMTLTVQIYTLPLNLIFSRAKVAFIIILSATCVSAICLMSLYLSGTSKTHRQTQTDNDFDSESFEQEDSQTDSIDDSKLQSETDVSEMEITEETEISENTEVPETEIEQNTESSQTEISDDTETFQPEITENIKAEESTESDNDIQKTKTDSESIDEVLSKPAPEHEDLFSSTTGFCFEKYLETRLESELARAASGEIDISLMLIQIPSINFDTPHGIEICKHLIDIFHYKDMLFEYKKDGIAVIYSNADIDKAMDSGELIYAELCSTLSGYNIKEKPYIGIASRSLRFISGERLIAEAEQALFHAKDDPESPIIAFRVNPEKYRKYMADKNNN
ncbi:MAG: hypothetical protein KBT21_03510 [Treponema sp.]|nr:hypothetical protein [Candidatus Treponema merdequi]